MISYAVEHNITSVILIANLCLNPSLSQIILIGFVWLATLHGFEIVFYFEK